MRPHFIFVAPPVRQRDTSLPLRDDQPRSGTYRAAGRLNFRRTRSTAACPSQCSVSLLCSSGQDRNAGQLAASVAAAKQRTRAAPGVAGRNSRASRVPDGDAPATGYRRPAGEVVDHHRIRNRRPSVNVSETKSSPQRWFDPCGGVIGASVPRVVHMPMAVSRRAPIDTDD